MKSLEEVLKPFYKRKLDEIGLDLTKTIKAFLNYNDVSASGSLINSIRYDIKSPTTFNLNLSIYADEYFKYIESGRKPGKFVPIKPLSDWLSDRGIPKEALYPINYHIYKYGIKPKPILSKVINKNKQKYLDELTEGYSNEIKKYLKQTINGNKKPT
jgi:hypothetical protein